MRVAIPKGVTHIVGIDEVGRGPIAGPITFGAVIVPRVEYLKLARRPFKDSKQLTQKNREGVRKEFKEKERAGKITCGVTSIRADIIDRDGISKVSARAVARLLKRFDLAESSTLVLLDGGLKAPMEYLYQKTVIKGDQKVPVIAMASVVAKVHRDRYMHKMARHFRVYGFENHVGYGTKAHYKALKKHGLCPLHRRSFLN